MSESGTTLTSPRGTEKYSVSSRQESLPEVATHVHQPPLQTYAAPVTSAFVPQTQYTYQEAGRQDGFESQHQPQQQQKRNPWGLSPFAFGILIALTTAIVVGAAVGGGVAGAMSGKDSSSNTAVSTVTVTAGGSQATATSSSSNPASTTTSGLPEPSSLQAFTVPEPYYIDTLADPGCQTSRINVQYDARFDLSCGIDIGNGRADSSDSSKIVGDFGALFAYSLTDCLYACANANYFTEKYGQDQEGGVMQLCKSVTWSYNMASNNASNFANCWLKNGTSSGYQCNSCISGILVE